MKIKKCPICGDEFTPKANKQKYCTDTCRVSARAEKVKGYTQKYNDIATETTVHMQKVFADLDEKDQSIFAKEVLEKGRWDNAIRQALTSPVHSRVKLISEGTENYLRPLTSGAGKKIAGNKAAVVAYRFGSSDTNINVEMFEDEIPAELLDSRVVGFYLKNSAIRKLDEVKEVIAKNDNRTTLLMKYGIYRSDLDRATATLYGLNKGSKMNEFVRQYCLDNYHLLPTEFFKLSTMANINGEDMTKYMSRPKTFNLTPSGYYKGLTYSRNMEKTRSKGNFEKDRIFEPWEAMIREVKLYKPTRALSDADNAFMADIKKRYDEEGEFIQIPISEFYRLSLITRDLLVSFTDEEY